MNDVASALSARFGADRVRTTALLAPFTTFKVGGAADILFESRTSEELVAALMLAHANGMPVTMLGGGSNMLIGDKGIRGLVIRPRGGTIAAIGDSLVRADASVTINGLVRWTIMRGAAGLEAWAGTPGTVGGAVFGNAHFGGRLIGESIAEVFPEVLEADYTASITADIGWAWTRNQEDPAYFVLNLCRTLAWLREKRILSKEEGAIWALQNLPSVYYVSIQQALKIYRAAQNDSIVSTFTEVYSAR